MSEVGEPAGDLLADVEGAERLPERRGSFGEGGGPIVATFAIMKVEREKGGEVAFEFAESSPLELRWLVRPQSSSSEYFPLCPYDRVYFLGFFCHK